MNSTPIMLSLNYLRLSKVIIVKKIFCRHLFHQLLFSVSVPSRKGEGGVKCSWSPWRSSPDCGRERRSLGWLKNFGQNMKENIEKWKKKVENFKGRVEKWQEKIKSVKGTELGKKIKV